MRKKSEISFTENVKFHTTLRNIFFANREFTFNKNRKHNKNSFTKRHK